MARTHYNEIAGYYISLVFRYSKFDGILIEGTRPMWESAKAVIEALPFDEWCKMQIIHERRFLTGTYRHNKPEDYRLMDKIYKTFAQQVGLI